MIPTCRRPAELNQALRSVLLQQNVTIEVFVVDDDPDGAAQEVVSAIADPRIRYLRMPRSTGGRPALVRNTALPHITASLVHFLDDDDEIPAGYYARMKVAFDAAPAVGVIFGRIVPFGTDVEAVRHETRYFKAAARRARRCCWFGPRWGFTAAMLFENAMLVCSAVMIRRSCMSALDGFDGNLEVVEDIEFYIRAIRRHGATFLDDAVLHYRIGQSLMHRPGVKPVITAGYEYIYRRYKKKWGAAEFYALKIFARAFPW